MAAVFSHGPQRTGAKVLQKQNTWKSGCTAFMKKNKKSRFPTCSLSGCSTANPAYCFSFCSRKKNKKTRGTARPLAQPARP